MKVTSTVLAVALVASLGIVAVGWSVDPAVGIRVDDSVAAELRGGKCIQVLKNGIDYDCKGGEDGYDLCTMGDGVHPETTGVSAFVDDAKKQMCGSVMCNVEVYERTTCAPPG